MPAGTDPKGLKDAVRNLVQKNLLVINTLWHSIWTLTSHIVMCLFVLLMTVTRGSIHASKTYKPKPPSEKTLEKMNKETMKAYEQYIKKLPNDAVKKTVKEGDNEPLFFGKDQWQQDKQKSLNAYNAVKEQHDTMKANGITDKHRKQANEQLAKDNPSYHEKSKQAFLSIKLHQLAELDNLAKQYGADKHAIAGQTYKGKIIQSDGKMSLQQTQDGIVLHRVGNLTVGKGYTLSHDDKTYSIQQDYKIRTKNQDRQQDKGKGFGE
ncbi:hypothetical protein A9Z65_03650 [Moraxella nonliquefaciens]|jgi:hypothetical protein|nr:hypothetical protein [Moraxella nonliquefaciens]OBX48336.1 hypothetical protein A9Z65_03650 [Moraxella nonliquefaciens]